MSEQTACDYRQNGIPTADWLLSHGMKITLHVNTGTCAMIIIMNSSYIQCYSPNTTVMYGDGPIAVSRPLRDEVGDTLLL